MSNQINRDRLLERFLAYVGVDTAANPDTTRYPSSAGQWELGNLLTQQLEDLGADYPHQDEHGLVWASVPATDGGNSPTIALIAHLDTSPEAPSANISPQVIKNYEGGDILLPSGQVIRVDQTPELNDLIGSTLITTDGTTLLGGDDKAGVAIIMELAQHLIENPHLEHGTVRILFTCDEEIGRGTDKINLSKLDAAAAYTLDGGGAGDLDVETFSADAATVTFAVTTFTPQSPKVEWSTRSRVAAYFVDLLPRDQQTPETTSGREGFIHAHNIHGGVGNATVELILRSFDTAELDLFADQIRTLAETVQEQFPGLQVDVQVRSQYRNLAEGLQQSPEVVQFAEQAYQNLQRTYRKTIIRGGTDGSQLTEKGLPTPNLSSGQHNIHAVHEFACLDQMEDAIEHLVELLRLWSQQAKS